MRILVSDKLSANGIDILKKAGLEVDVKTGLAPEELKEIISSYDGIIIRSATKLTSDIIEAAQNLKVIGRAGSGLDNVDKNAATNKGIVVMNTPGGNTTTTAEHAIALLLSMARSIPQATASTKQGKWEKKRFMGVEVYNKILGIIGLGQIGAEVAKKAQGLQMNVLAFDPYLSKERARDLGVKLVSFEELLKEADFITLHTSLTTDTKGMINARAFRLMKEEVRLVNCSRGGIVDERALYEALKVGKVASAALDVFEKEPPEVSPLFELDNFICTPHLGASTTEAQENVARAVAEQIVDYLTKGVIRNAVNFPSLPPDMIQQIHPFANLGERIGSFLCQLIDVPIKEVVLEYKGEVCQLPREPITIAILKGVLTPVMGDEVNYVNAPVIAKNRGIEVKEVTTGNAGDYLSMIGLKIRGNGSEYTISGVLHGKSVPRIVKLKGFVIEVVPEGEMLVISNNDVPGVIGNIGTLLGKNHINIARMQWGRERPGGRAISIVSIETEPKDAIIAELKELDNVLSIERVSLPLLNYSH
jgi:D-3-phosphoglycerate dehydrogenase